MCRVRIDKINDNNETDENKDKMIFYRVCIYIPVYTAENKDKINGYTAVPA